MVERLKDFFFLFLSLSLFLYLSLSLSLSLYLYLSLCLITLQFTVLLRILQPLSFFRSFMSFSDTDFFSSSFLSALSLLCIFDIALSCAVCTVGYLHLFKGRKRRKEDVKKCHCCSTVPISLTLPLPLSPSATVNIPSLLYICVFTRVCITSVVFRK